MNMVKNRIFRKLEVLGVYLFITVILLVIHFADFSSGQQNIGQPMGNQPTNNIQVLNITFSDDTPMEKDIIIISTYIKNNGSTPITNLTVTFLLNNQEVIKNVTDITVGINESKLVKCEWTTEKGTQNIGIRLYVNGNPIQIPMLTENIYVEQEPLGDIETLIYAILVIFIFILTLVILPSIWSAVQPEIKPYEHLKRFQKP